MPTLVLLRHGQSQWNLENRFTGWWDVDLSPAGVIEARDAGRLMREHGLDFDCCFTSVLTRAIRTLHLVLHEMDRLWLPVAKDWRLCRQCRVADAKNPPRTKQATRQGRLLPP